MYGIYTLASKQWASCRQSRPAAVAAASRGKRDSGRNSTLWSRHSLVVGAAVSLSVRHCWLMHPVARQGNVSDTKQVFAHNSAIHWYDCATRPYHRRAYSTSRQHRIPSTRSSRISDALAAMPHQGKGKQKRRAHFDAKAHVSSLDRRSFQCIAYHSAVNQFDRQPPAALDRCISSEPGALCSRCCTDT